MPGRRAAQRHKLAHHERKAAHLYRDVDGLWKPRAAFETEGAANRAQRRLLDLTGRRYSAYRCLQPSCDAWHIRPCPLRPGDLARSA
jgi:hypothetical protein